MKKKKLAPSSGKISVQTASEAKKFKKHEKAEEDKQQRIFGADGAIKPNPSKFAVIEGPKIDFNKKVTCPICLSWGSLNKFLISTKKGYDKGSAKCPFCNRIVKIKTLFGLTTWTPEQYAHFVYTYPAGAFFAKVKEIPGGFDKWKERLRIMKWSTQFWSQYRAEKAESGEETIRKADEYEADWADREKEAARKEFDKRQVEWEKSDATKKIEAEINFD